MYLLYRTLTGCLSPLIPLLLKRRLKQGKEDAQRLGERLGRATLPRPKGKLLWVHAASVGEANAAVTLLDALHVSYPTLTLLLTTVTVTSAALMKKRSGTIFIHQFAPVDTPGAVRSFLDHWQPHIALWVDSELWPNMIREAHRRNIVLGMINARMSERSFRRWSIIRPFSKRMLSCFSLCFAQGAEDGARLLHLGMPDITDTGNLKYDAPAPACEEAELGRLRSALAKRTVWLAASTHPGEEQAIAAVHASLKPSIPELLTIIAPRHGGRGDAIRRELAAYAVAQRSKGEPVTAYTELYLADTMGELGLFYRLAPVAFIGGSLVAHGGQNPLEAAKLGCAILAGPHMGNFAAITRDMLRNQAIVQVQDAGELAEAVRALLTDEAMRRGLGMRAFAHARDGEGITARIMNRLQPYLA